MRLSPHAQKIERLLTPGMAEAIAAQTRGWYGDPLPVFGTPYALRGDGDFVGQTFRQRVSDLSDYAMSVAKSRLRRFARGQLSTAGMGFSSLGDLIAEASAGKAQNITFNKVAVTAAPAVGASQFLWKATTYPVAGANAAAGPGGTVPDRTTQGALGQTNAAGGDTLHLTTWSCAADRVCALMLLDYTFGVNVTCNVANQAVTGVPTRYQDAVSARNTCVIGRHTTAGSAVASNLTLTYKDQDNNTAEAAAAWGIRQSGAVETSPITQPYWFVPLNAGDTGLRSITNVATSGANTGVADWCIVKPLAIIPVPVANLPFILDGINSAFSLVQIVDNACLAFQWYVANATNVINTTGMITLVSG